MFLRFLSTCCVFFLCQGETTKYALLGKKVHLSTNIQPFPDEILWKHNGNKVIEFNGNKEDVYGSYKGRVTLDWISADLNISDVRFEDSGAYELELFINQKMHYINYNLQVIDKVTRPSISCERIPANGSSESGYQATLTCSAESKQSQSLLKFNWGPNGNMQLGPKLVIPLGNEHDAQVYDCTVSNPLSKESETFTAKECYPGKTLTLCV
ncbi:CD48 antigen-like [Nematolebias whitei]|uniref:CD48 antigen-like n=1 Tax=Nematolebias whitei TaxID=451745 RepID=UPI00189C4E5B|nr:CD48 antigen-like [Nematolebias whitei]